MSFLTALAALVLAFLQAVAAPGPHSSNGPIVALDSGRIEGVRLAPDLSVFRGIPYAAPPVGELRWRAPEAVKPWEGVRSAKEFGAACPQGPLIAYLSGETLPATSEDCLTLNVWTPSDAAGAKLPVLVWIHGGGFVGGWAHQRLYDGATFAARGLVFVSLQYRLGPLGYLALPELAAEAELGAPANHGLLDQVAALRWVQRNIAAFGGDPGRVTVMGESAGATSVLALCIAPAAKGLFHAAIAQSAWYTETNFVTLAEARESARELSALLLPDEKTRSLAALRALPADALWQKLGDRFQPSLALDGCSLWARPEEVFAAGKQNDVPLLAGTTADEGTAFLPLFPYRTVDAFQAGLEREFGADTDDVLALYPVADDGDVPSQLAHLVTDRWFVRGTRSLLRGMSRSWQYVFTRANPALPSLGAHHAVELPYVFAKLDTNAGPADHELSQRMLARWGQFAKTGDPNGAGLPSWPAFEREHERYLVFGERDSLGEHLRRETCDLLDRLRSARLEAQER
ncbi:MAG: carboxylesterase family protein [Planctomycetes bacterium]|nr:carboxylesterase family protein [Planctomycetota bacterium]